MTLTTDLIGGGTLVEGGGWASDILAAARRIADEPAKVARGFVGKLRSYQSEALAWLGFRLVGDWLESRDGYGVLAADHVLAGAAAELVGGRRDKILDWLRRAKPGDFAALARPIVEQATDGDAYACGLLDEAAGHHARLARALAPTPAEPPSSRTPITP